MPVQLDSMSSESIFADFGRVVWRNNRAAAGRLAQRCRAPTARSVAGLHVHSSTTRHTLARALAEAVPSLAANLSDRKWAALSTGFIARHPPRRAALYQWGDEMPAFLAAQSAKADVIDLAKLDRAALRAFFAAEAEPIATAALTAFTPADIQRIGLTIHPSLQRLHVSPAATNKWLELTAIPQVEHRREEDADGALVVLVRPDAHIRALVVSSATDALLGALSRGATLIEACEEAMSHNSSFDFQSVLASFFADGLFIDCVAREVSDDRADED